MADQMHLRIDTVLCHSAPLPQWLPFLLAALIDGIRAGSGNELGDEIIRLLQEGIARR